MDDPSLICCLIFSPLPCFLLIPEVNYWKRERTWASLKQRLKSQLFSHLNSKSSDILKSDSRINHPKNFKKEKEKIILMSSPLWLHHTPQIVWYYCSVWISYNFHDWIKIKLKTEFDFSVFLIFTTVPRILQLLNTYIYHSSITYW